ncbi:MAG TPA: hypothetical protein VIV40_27080 [Kofleriaceae bacterium]
MTRSLLLLGVLCSGCVVLPATKTTTRNAGTEQSALTYGRVKGLSLQTGSSHTDIRVRALSQRECHRQIFAVTEIKKTKHARLGVDDPRGRVLGLAFSPVTIPISAIITGLIVASSDDETSRITKPLRTETIECTKDAAGLALELEFPSGHIYRGKTDANGVLVFAIPRDEPYGGEVKVRGDNVATELHYEEVRPPVTTAREAVERCRLEHQVSGVRLELVIDERGNAKRIRLSSGDDAFKACVSAKIAGVVFPSALRNATVVLPFEPPAT